MLTVLRGRLIFVNIILYEEYTLDEVRLRLRIVGA